jgi:hypothetical protein
MSADRDNRAMRRKTIIVGLLALGAIAIGCGSDEDEEPAPEPEPTSVKKTRSEIRGAVDRFNIAAEGLDAELLCNDVLPPSSVSEEPERCEAAVDTLMRENPENWQPFGTVRKIRVQGEAARARGVQGESRAGIRFVREDGRWYVEVFD